MPKYLIGRGTLKVATRDASGNPLALRDLGECPTIEVTPSVEYADNYDTKGCVAVKDAHVPVRRDVSLSVTIKEITAKNMALLFGSDVVAIASGSASALPFPSSAIVAGDEYRLPDNSVNVTSLVITDSAGTPATLVSGTDYTANLKTGTVKFLSVAGKTQPFKASFTRTAGESVPLFTSNPPELYLIAEIENAAENCKKYVFEAFKVTFDQPQTLSLKGETFAEFSTTVTVLKDETKPTGTPLGQYARWAQVEA